MSVGKASIKRALGAKDAPVAAPAEEVKAPAAETKPVAEKKSAAKKPVAKKPAAKKPAAKKPVAKKSETPKVSVSAPKTAFELGEDLPYYLL